jgi:hypothetical protein
MKSRRWWLSRRRGTVQFGLGVSIGWPSSTEHNSTCSVTLPAQSHLVHLFHQHIA